VRLRQEVQKLPRTLSPNAEIVERLLAALRARDEAAVVAELHPEVEAVGARGLKQGPAEVVAWAKPSVDGALVSSVEVDELREVAGEWVAVAARRLWTWTETGDVADEEPFGVLFRIRDGKVVSWNQTYGSMTDAIDAIPAS
jgi:limonene-1,2-epoxide hydrolase